MVLEVVIHTLICMYTDVAGAKHNSHKHEIIIFKLMFFSRSTRIAKIWNWFVYLQMDQTHWIPFCIFPAQYVDIINKNYIWWISRLYQSNHKQSIVSLRTWFNFSSVMHNEKERPYILQAAGWKKGIKHRDD